MSYFRPCPYCGAHLDPGEACDCQSAPEVQQVPIIKQSKVKTKTKKVLIIVDSKGAAKACNW